MSRNRHSRSSLNKKFKLNRNFDIKKILFVLFIVLLFIVIYVMTNTTHNNKNVDPLTNTNISSNNDGTISASSDDIQKTDNDNISINLSVIR